MLVPKMGMVNQICETRCFVTHGRTRPHPRFFCILRVNLFLTTHMSIDSQAAVVSLPKELRYEHFIRRVADTGRVWGLYRDGWAIGKTDDGALVFPLWPTSELAQQCAVLEWEGLRAAGIRFAGTVRRTAAATRSDGILPGITYTPDEYGLTPSHAQLARRPAGAAAPGRGRLPERLRRIRRQPCSPSRTTAWPWPPLKNKSCNPASKACRSPNRCARARSACRAGTCCMPTPASRSRC
jgi:hypothetical protein